VEDINSSSLPAVIPSSGGYYLLLPPAVIPSSGGLLLLLPPGGYTIQRTSSLSPQWLNNYYISLTVPRRLFFAAQNRE
jgi:hypothetical protein